MPRALHRYYHLNHLHFITCSCYQRRPALARPEHRTLFVEILSKVLSQYDFALLGYVVMPEHFHLLLSEPTRGDPSTIMQVLKQTVARKILGILRGPRTGSRAGVLLAELENHHQPGKAQLWHRRFYDFNIWSEKKRWEKLEYMHLNPVERGLVKRPGDWPWSSYRFYALGDTRLLAMDSWPP